MMKIPGYLSQDRWPLARMLMLLLVGGFSGLMADIRVEHVDVVRERSIAWMPIIYSGVMAIVCFAACLFWETIPRICLLLVFSTALVVGGMGFYFHNHGDFLKVITTSLQAWTDPKMEHADAPPQLAPLAFAGLGMIGMLASMKRFKS